MSLLGAISNSMSGMRAIQADMQVISGNVSNAQDPNYTRKTINLSADTISGGVLVSGYSRSTNTNLSTLLQQSLGDSGLRGTQGQYLQGIQDLMGTSQGTPILTQTMSDFAASWRQLSAQPENTAQQQDVVFKAQNLVREVNRLQTGLNQIRTNAQNDMQSSVDLLNSTIDSINNLNQQIVAAKSSGTEQTVNNLLDQRDAEVRTLSGLVNVKVFNRAQDTVGVYTPQGLSLLDAIPSHFTWNGNTITLDPGGGDVTDQLLGGKLEALAGVLDQGTTAATLADPAKAGIYKIQAQLTQLVTMFTSTASPNTFAAAYNGAATATGELGSGFFTGTTPATFAVAANLANGTNTVKQASAVIIADDMDVNTRSIAAAGLTINNTSYTGYTDAITSTQNQNLQIVKGQAELYKSQADSYTQQLQSSVGVNIDDEMALLTMLQNNYAASARVLTTIQQMYQSLEQIL
jgi:flagellar hook-associated protein 1 FlgK